MSLALRHWLLLLGLVLTANEASPTLATALGVVGALGMFLCASIIRRHQRP